MPAQLLDLPTELQLMICTDFIKPHSGYRRDGIALSYSCRYYRYLLRPRILEFLLLRNTVPSAKAALALSRTDDRKYVKEIYIIPELPPNNLNDDQLDALDIGSCTTEEMAELAPRICADTGLDEYVQVLSTLGSCFPNLVEVTVGFDLYDDSGWPPGSDVLFSSDDEEDWDIESSEMEEPWRTVLSWRMVLNDTYDALARGCSYASSQVKTLNLLHVPPVEALALSTPQFHTFLGRLCTFNMVLWGEQDKDGNMSNTNYDTHDFPANLGMLFFEHLQQCQTLSLEAALESPLGHNNDEDAECHIPLRLEPKWMPLLRKLFLEHIFIDDVLCKFLVAHSSTLEIVDLCNCFSEASDPDGIGVAWSELFDRVTDSNPTRLKEFEIQDDEFSRCVVSYLERDHGEESDDELDFQSQLANFKKTYEEDESIRVFRYAHLDVDTGSVKDILESFCKAFRDGHDQIAYNRLTDLMRKNS